MNAKTLNTARLIAFSLLSMPVTAIMVPLNIYLPALIAKITGIALPLLGLIFLIGKLWGAAADPVIGVLSDRTTSTFGRRRIWMAAGGLVFFLAMAATFFPPEHMPPAYLLIVLLALFSGWSMVQIPYYALSAEITSDYDERTRVATYQLVTASAALFLVLLLPTIAEQIAPSDARLELHLMGGALLVLLCASLPFALTTFREAPDATPHRRTHHSVLAGVRIVFANTLLIRILASDFAINAAQSIRGALLLFYVAALGFPRLGSGLFLAQFAFGLIAGPIWMKASFRLGKHRAAIVAELLQAAINVGLLFVTRNGLFLLLALTVAQGLCQASGNLMLRAMVADVADEDRLRTGEDHTALFFSVFSVSTKAALGVAIGLALPLVSYLGFDPKLATNTPDAVRGLILVFALGPALFHVVAAALLYRFPLDAEAQAAIRRRLAEGARRA